MRRGDNLNSMAASLMVLIIALLGGVLCDPAHRPCHSVDC